VFTTFAAEEASGGLLGALGIDGRLFVTQLIAFLILLFILKKWVFPPIVRAIDKRQETIDATVREAAEARAALEKAESKAGEVLAEARQEAEGVLARSQEEAAKAIAESESKAKERANQIVADARTQLDADVKKARAALKKDTVQLVAAATEQIITEKVDTAKDKALIERSLEKAEA
jgi:F-type H+-transporting ATPase subunit b